MVGAIAIGVAHNHPSGSVEPSQEDISVTNRLKEAGTLLGIQLLDHVIVSDFAFNSLREDNRCWSQSRGSLALPIAGSIGTEPKAAPMPLNCWRN